MVRPMIPLLQLCTQSQNLPLFQLVGSYFLSLASGISSECKKNNITPMLDKVKTHLLNFSKIVMLVVSNHLMDICSSEIKVLVPGPS